MNQFSFSKPISHVGAINASAIFTSAWFQAWYLQDHPHCIVKTLCTAESEVARLESPVAWVVSGYVQPTLLGQRAFISTYSKKSIYFFSNFGPWQWKIFEILLILSIGSRIFKQKLFRGRALLHTAYT